MKRVGLALDRQQCYGHGQIYVAFSRVSRMSGIKVFNTTGSTPNRILNIVCKEILDEEDSKVTNVKDIDLHQPSVGPEPAYAQTTMDDFITTRDTSNGAKDCIPPRVPSCGPDIDCGPDFVPWYAPDSTDDEEVNDNERIEHEDTTFEGGVIPRMPSYHEPEDMDCDANLFTTSCPPIIVSQPTKNKSPQRFNDDELMIVEPSTSTANKSGKPDLLDRETLRQEPIEKRKAVRTGDNPSQKKQREIKHDDFERKMIGDGNCFFR